jgi:glycosyltransferase involved in cell wall biosynthesis
MGSGYTRASEILKLMGDLGYAITLYPTDLSDTSDWRSVYSDINREVEVMTGWGLQKLEDFLGSRRDYYDIIFVSRPHNMNHINYILSRANLLSGAKIIYDAEALYCFRDFAKADLEGRTLSDKETKRAIVTELSLAKHAKCILSVSPREQQQFIKHGYPQVEILGHSLAVNPTPNTYQQRRDLLFVGSVYELNSPNADSILWLAAEIMPQIQAQLDLKLLVAGTNQAKQLQTKISQYQNDAIKMLGRVPDLSQLYNQARIFVAPTRYAAGIPHKVHEASARGIPVVTTSLIAQQLGWQAETDLLVADTATEFAEACIRLDQDAELWQKLRNNALSRIEQECSPERFKTTLKAVLS